MGKKVNTDSTDEALNYVKDRSQRMVLASGEPSNYSEVSGVTLGDISFGSSEFTVGAANGGRQYQTEPVSNITIDADGSVTHVLFVNDTSGVLLDVTTCNSVSVLAGETGSVESFKRIINDPT